MNISFRIILERSFCKGNLLVLEKKKKKFYLFDYKNSLITFYLKF